MDEVVSQLVSIALNSSYDSLSGEIVNAVKRHVIDGLGCAFGGYREPSAVIARRIAGAVTADKPITVLGAGIGTQAELAAFANGVMVRCLDLNDTYTSSGGVGHPSDYIPAVLAAGEESGADGKTIVSGIVAAYDVFGSLTDATNYGVYGWDHTTNGVVASAVGAGIAFHLNSDQLADAIRLAAVANFALHESRLGDVAMWKGCASANACRNGIFAARLAMEGISGPPMVFQGHSGVINVASPKFDYSKLAREANDHAIAKCHIKRYPAGFFSQSAIDAARELHVRIGDIKRISGVRLGTFPFGKEVMAGDRQKWHPVTRESADHSLPFLVATALVHGDVNQASFTEEALKDPEVRRVLDVLTVEVDDQSAAAWPGEARNDLSVKLSDGSQEQVVVKDYEGHFRNPMSDEAVTSKFMVQAEEILGHDEADKLVRRLWHLEEASEMASLLRTSVVASKG